MWQLVAGAGGFRTRITVQLPKNERRRFDPEDWNTTTSIHPSPHNEIAIVGEMVKFCCENGGQIHNMGVSKNRGTPKWMVYNRKHY